MSCILCLPLISAAFVGAIIIILATYGLVPLIFTHACRQRKGPFSASQNLGKVSGRRQEFCDLDGLDRLCFHVLGIRRGARDSEDHLFSVAFGPHTEYMYSTASVYTYIHILFNM